MAMVLTALSVMIAATLIQHLGLAEAVVGVLGKVTKCNQCFVFWSVLAALVYDGCNIIQAVVLSILAAYLSNWFILILIQLQRLFDYIYGKEKDKG